VSTSSFQPQEIKSPAWARYYRRYGTSFARSAAPRVRSSYESTYGDRADRSLLDVCCGQGTLALHFLKHGYRVTGIDLSEPMLAFARQNLHEHLQTGQARLVRADAASFSVEDRFGLAIATFDSLNMLQSHAAFKSCFECVRRSLLDEGMFVFDLMTRRGFWQDYNGVWVGDTEDELYVLQERLRRRGQGGHPHDGLRPRGRPLGAVRGVPHANAISPARRGGGAASGRVVPAVGGQPRRPCGGRAGREGDPGRGRPRGVLGLLGVAALPPDVIVEQTDEGPRYHVPDDWFLAIPAGGSGRG
jgi:SAM-dependent methyltransferase